MKNNIFFCFAILIAFALFSASVLGAASFQVSSFSCSPPDVVINSVFSCTANIKNAGDASGSVGTATLYPDASNWLESSNYPQTSGESISPGSSMSITFTGLKAVKSGNNGFSKIMLDNVEDKYVSDNNKKVNVINVAVSLENSASSAVMGGSWTSTSEISAGGNIDVVLTFVSNSGGCSIGSQTNPKSFSGLTDGAKQSWAWTITQGTTGSCKYTLSASAISAGGYASKIDSTSSTVTCTNCPTPPSNNLITPGGGSAGGAGGGGIKAYVIGELVSPSLVDLSNGEEASFNISGREHFLTLANLTETSAKITIESEKQTFTLVVGDEINVDLNNDNQADISVMLSTINIITKKASILLSRVSGGVPGISEKNPAAGESPKSSGVPGGIGASSVLWIILGLFVITAVLSAYYYFKRRNDRIWGKRI